MASATAGRKGPARECPMTTSAAPAAPAARWQKRAGESLALRRSGTVVAQPRDSMTAARGATVDGPTSGLRMIRARMAPVCAPHHADHRAVRITRAETTRATVRYRRRSATAPPYSLGMSACPPVRRIPRTISQVEGSAPAAKSERVSAHAVVSHFGNPLADAPLDRSCRRCHGPGATRKCDPGRVSRHRR